MRLGGDDPVLMEGRDAFERSDWAAALSAFERADAPSSLGLDDLERAAVSAMWLGELESCIAFRQRAFAMCGAGGEARRSAGLAIDLCIDQARAERIAVAMGWLQRAERLLDGYEPCSELGRLADLRALVALEIGHDVEAASGYYAEALRIGRACDDADLIACGLVGSGTVLVRQGRVAEGLRLVDEAMIDAVSGMLGNLMTARIYCGTISLCQALGDIRRASEWTEQAVACSARPGMCDFPGDCRMHRAEITRLRGDWVAAESELHRVMRDLERWSDGGHVGQAWYELGEIALRRGDLAAAGDAFDRAAAHGKDPQPGLAMLRLALGEEFTASALLRVAVANAGHSDPLAVGQLLPAMVEVQLACGDVEAAADAAGRLESIARVYGTVILAARAATSRAQVALAQGATEEALAGARAAVNLWREAGAPYETAQTQHLLAEAAVRADDRPVAIVELDAALAAFTNLGASRDIEAAQRLRDRLGQLEVGQRVCRTFVFTDIVDSTPLVAAMGDERWSAVLRWHDNTIRDLLREHRGTEVKQRGGGDGFFVVFIVPSDAISCAVGIQRRFAQHRDAHGFAPDVRIGVHQADALLSGHDYAGLGVHEAARIAALANGGEILASQATVNAAPTTNAEPPHDVTLKGLNDRVAVQAIHWDTNPTGSSQDD
jgi:class 3 adenylate cyclase